MKKQSFCEKANSVYAYKTKPIQKPTAKVLYFLIVLFLGIILYTSGVGCVWRHFFHIVCPGCGITNACLKFFQGEFKEALKSNYMFLSLPVIGLYIFFDGRIFKSKKIDYAILSIIALGFLVHWIFCLLEL